MKQLNAVISHLPAGEVEQDMRALRELSPDAEFLCCYTGPRSEFERLGGDAILLEDDWLGGAPRTYQSYHGVFAALAERSFDALYLIEYDQLVLDPGFEAALIALAEGTGAGFMGKNCVPRNGTNWPHYARFRRDRELFDHLRRISTREDPTVIFGTLGTGMWLSRDALDSYLSLEAHPRCYGELYVPTILHHLGHPVVDIDAISDLYRHVRWQPDYELAEIASLERDGAVFVHPVKSAATRRAAAAAR
ncbi:MAG TPA: hypothetical protein VH391_10930 [Solirubrobacterales bacterium]